ncbi:acyltransferase family protein [Pseudoluteimonas lycopersici]|uniref:acyltransferase family protein n=1 Tax=Pseudoluteimonas lycopersici TaxID=1324796 RepID=UPI00319E6C45
MRFDWLRPRSARRGHAQERLAFRPDVEGLRAVAIALVVAAHAGVPWLAGGFVGVDVFFVLSGYLISGLLYKEIQSSGRLGLATFYARRLQRLLPALLLTIACTIVAAIFLLAPFEQLAQTDAAAAAATWTSNIYFALSKLDYFGPSAETNLFLHTWSLGVEEQFYLLWPVLMLFLLGAWHWQGKHFDDARLRRGLGATVVLCVLLSASLTYTSPQLGFYMVFSRAWQFALGGLVFLSMARIAEPMPARLARIRSAGGWLGLAAILASALLLDAHTPYPGLWALLPSLGTAAVLAGAEGPRQVARVLALPPLQAIGRVSYAWYLWHWPILLLGLTLVDGDNPWQVAGLVAISLLLAFASSALIESPLRHARYLRARPWMVIVVGLALMACTAIGAFTWNRSAQAWARHGEQARVLQARSDLSEIYAYGCDEWYQTARVRSCFFGPENAPHTAVLFGDSVAGQWFPAVATHFQRPGWKVLVLTKSSCPMIERSFFYARIGRVYVECDRWRHDAIALLHELKPDIVLLGSSSAYEFTSKEWMEGTRDMLDALDGASRHIGIFQPTPLLPFDGPACLARRQWRARWLPTPAPCNAPAGNAKLDMIRQAIARGAAKHPAVKTIDMDDDVCPGGRCDVLRDGTIAYRDKQHITATFAAALAPALGTALREAGLDPADASTSPEPPATSAPAKPDPPESDAKRQLSRYH